MSRGANDLIRLSEHDAFLTVESGIEPKVEDPKYHKGRRIIGTLLFGCAPLLVTAGWGLSRNREVAVVPDVGQADQTTRLWAFANESNNSETLDTNKSMIPLVPNQTRGRWIFTDETNDGNTGGVAIASTSDANTNVALLQDQTTSLWTFIDKANNSYAGLADLPFKGDIYKSRALLQNLVYNKGSTFKHLRFDKCALVGASEFLNGTSQGEKIDSYDTVIRTNRVPTSEYYKDFGSKTTVLVVNEAHQIDGQVVRMGPGEEVVLCNSMPSCMDAAIIAGPGFAFDDQCPVDELTDVWGATRPLVGCTTKPLKHLAWRFTDIQVPSTGFIAFLIFASICTSLDVYGFSGNGTADGHYEWSNHTLEQEHAIQHSISRHDWANINVDVTPDNGFPEVGEYWDWFKARVNEIHLRIQ